MNKSTFYVLISLLLLLVNHAAWAQVVLDNGKPDLVKFVSTTPNGSYKTGDRIELEAIFDDWLGAGSVIRVLLNTGDTIALTFDPEVAEDILDPNWGVSNTNNIATVSNSDGVYCITELTGGKNNQFPENKGKMVIAGSFRSYEGSPYDRLVVTDKNGKSPQGFPAYFDNDVAWVIETQDGGLLVGGSFVNYGGNGLYDHLVKFKYDAVQSQFVVDVDFMNKLTSRGSATNGVISQPCFIFGKPQRGIQQHSDGSIYIVGSFTGVGGVSKMGMAKLNSDGSVNTAFNFRESLYCSTMTLDDDDPNVIWVGTYATERVYRINKDTGTPYAYNGRTYESGPGNGILAISLLPNPTETDSEGNVGPGGVLVTGLGNVLGGAGWYYGGGGANALQDNLTPTPLSQFALGGEGWGVANVLGSWAIDGAAFAKGKVFLGLHDAQNKTGTGQNNYEGGVVVLNYNGSLNESFNHMLAANNHNSTYGDGIGGFFSGGGTDIVSLYVTSEDKLMVGGNYGSIMNYTTGPDVRAITRLSFDRARGVYEVSADDLVVPIKIVEIVNDTITGAFGGSGGVISLDNIAEEDQFENNHNIAVNIPYIAEEDKFITTWKTTAANESITLPVLGTQGLDYYVDWGITKDEDGDGVPDGRVPIITHHDTTNPTYTYPTAGTYTIKIMGGRSTSGGVGTNEGFFRFAFQGRGDKDKILSVKQWGKVPWTGMQWTFKGCTNLQVDATDVPDLSRVSSMTEMFMGCSSFNSNINLWDVSNVTDMSYMFREATNFNSDISSWNTEKVTSMKQMFYKATSFNGAINTNEATGSWNVSKVTDMSAMFLGAKEFNQTLKDWNVSSVNNVESMFNSALAFNQDLSSWQIPELTRANGMLNYSGLSVDNYDKLLVSWNQQVQAGTANATVPFSAVGVNYCFGEVARERLIDAGWGDGNPNNGSGEYTDITDAGPDCLDAFITTWKVEANGTVEIPLVSGQQYDFIIDWGDGDMEAYSGTGLTCTHTYTHSSEEVKTIKISGVFPQIYFANSAAQAQKIQTVEQWGTVAWTSMRYAFGQCSNLRINAPDAPDLSQVIDMEGMFTLCSAMNDPIGHWEVGTIKTMGNLFALATSFNQDLSNWSVESVVVMSGMFQGAKAFDQDLGAWNIASLTTAVDMFSNSGLSVENYDNLLIEWNKQVQAQKASATISFGAKNVQYCEGETAREALIAAGWGDGVPEDQSGNYTDIVDGGLGCAFISTWLPAGGTITIPTSTSYSYDYDISIYDSQSGLLLEHATRQTGNYTSKVLTADSVRVEISRTFPTIQFKNEGDKDKIIRVDSWGDIQWESMQESFQGCTRLVSVPGATEAEAPNLSFSGINFSSMFYGCSAFNSNLSGWDISRGTGFAYMFKEATVFNNGSTSNDGANPLRWKMKSDDGAHLASGAFNGMFAQAFAFNQNLNTWNVSKGTAFGNMFEGSSRGHTIFNNGSITDDQLNPFTWTMADGPNVAKGSFYGMFQWNFEFNQSLSTWGMSEAIGFAAMFFQARKFNQNLNNWNVSKVTTFWGMFANAIAFNNGSTSNDEANPMTWKMKSDDGVNVASGSFQMMFFNAPRFNQDLSSWTMGAATNLSSMFEKASIFDQNLEGWDISAVSNAALMLDNSGMSVDNYDRLLIGWNKQVQAGTAKPAVKFSARGVQYCIGEEARTELMESGWGDGAVGTSGDDIVDGGFGCPFITTWIPGGKAITIPTGSYVCDYEIKIYDAASNELLDSAKYLTGNYTSTVLAVSEADSVRVEIFRDFPHLYFNDGKSSSGTVIPAVETSKTQIIRVDQWGNIKWRSMANAFHGCSNLQTTDAGAPDLSVVVNLSYMFAGCSSLDNYISAWDVTNVRDMSYMFKGASAFTNANATGSRWGEKTANVRNMAGMFEGASSFNQNLNDWDVSSVTDMSGMFKGATVFNNKGVDLTWFRGTSTSKVIYMSEMFMNATAFNRNINAWDVSSVVNMSSMFKGATAFNNGGSTALAWATGTGSAGVKNMSSMFSGATAFNSDIRSLQVSGVTIMDSMFYGATSFNQDLSGWNVSSVVSMPSMFEGAVGFNNGGKALSWGSTAKVTSLSNMFKGATGFDQDISTWQITALNTAKGMFENAQLSTANYDALLISWEKQVSAAGTSLNGILFHGGSSQYCIGATSRQTLISKGWESSTTSGDIVDGGEECSGNFVTTWEVGAGDVITLPVFSDSQSTRPVIIDWGDGNIEEFTGAYGPFTHTYATAMSPTIRVSGDLQSIRFNGGNTGDKIKTVEQWGDHVWTSMENAFRGCSNLTTIKDTLPNGDPNAFNLSEVKTMANMFHGCSSLVDTEPNYWDLSGVTDISGMFSGARVFNSNLSTWQINNVTTMDSLFQDAAAFNNAGEPMIWPEGVEVQVTSMAYMFKGATSFNQSARSWKVDKVTNTASMFEGAISFNNGDEPLDWGNLTAGISDMSSMFKGATSFNQDLGDWDIRSLTKALGMLDNSGLSTLHYDKLLVNWNADRNRNTRVPFSAVGIKYCFGESARESLINDGWGDGNPTASTDYLDILDGGLDCSGTFITRWKIPADQVLEIQRPVGNQNAVHISWGDGQVDFDLVNNTTHKYTLNAGDTVTIKMGGDPSMYWSTASGQKLDIQYLIQVLQFGDYQWESMESMFAHAHDMTFAEDVDTPDLSRMTNMSNMFVHCEAFNSDLNGWDVSQVKHMDSTFYQASSFDQALNGWDVSQVIHMDAMFQEALAFDQNLASWQIDSLDSASHMFKGAKLSVDNYDALLISWSNQVDQAALAAKPLGSKAITFHGGFSKYCAGEAARASLISKGWGDGDATNANSLENTNVTGILDGGPSVVMSNLKVSNVGIFQEEKGKITLTNVEEGVQYYAIATGDASLNTDTIVASVTGVVTLTTPALTDSVEYTIFGDAGTCPTLIVKDTVNVYQKADASKSSIELITTGNKIADGSDKHQIKVTIRDVLGVVIPGATVELSIPVNVSGTTPLTTGADGSVTFDLTSTYQSTYLSQVSSIVTENPEKNETSSWDVMPTLVSYTFVAGAPDAAQSTLELLTVVGQVQAYRMTAASGSINLSNNQHHALKVTLRDANGNLVPNYEVTFTAATANAGVDKVIYADTTGTGTLFALGAATSGLKTDVNGQITVFASSTKAWTDFATSATFDLNSVAQTVSGSAKTYSFINEFPDYEKSLFVVNPTEQTAGDTVLLTFTIKDVYNNPCRGRQTYAYLPTLGGATTDKVTYNGSSAVPIIAYTDDNGQSSIKASSTLANTYKTKGTLFIDGSPLDVNKEVSYKFIAAAPDLSKSYVELITDESLADGASSNELHAHIRDVYNNPVVGAKVQVAATGSVNWGSGVGSAHEQLTINNSGVVNGKGLARIFGKTTVAGTFSTEIRVDINGDGLFDPSEKITSQEASNENRKNPVIHTFVPLDPNKDKCEVTVSKPIAIANDKDSVIVTVLVRDINDNPVEGAVVVFYETPSVRVKIADSIGTRYENAGAGISNGLDAAGKLYVVTDVNGQIKLNGFSTWARVYQTTLALRDPNDGTLTGIGSAKYLFNPGPARAANSPVQVIVNGSVVGSNDSLEIELFDAYNNEIGVFNLSDGSFSKEERFGKTFVFAATNNVSINGETVSAQHTYTLNIGDSSIFRIPLTSTVADTFYTTVTMSETDIEGNDTGFSEMKNSSAEYYFTADDVSVEKSSVEITNNGANIDQGEQDQVKVTLRDHYNNPTVGIQVFFDQNRAKPGLSFVDGVENHGRVSGVTDAQGVFIMNIASTDIGLYGLDVSYRTLVNQDYIDSLLIDTAIYFIDDYTIVDTNGLAIRAKWTVLENSVRGVQTAVTLLDSVGARAWDINSPTAEDYPQTALSLSNNWTTDIKFGTGIGPYAVHFTVTDPLNATRTATREDVVISVVDAHTVWDATKELAIRAEDYALTPSQAALHDESLAEAASGVSAWSLSDWTKKNLIAGVTSDGSELSDIRSVVNGSGTYPLSFTVTDGAQSLANTINVNIFNDNEWFITHWETKASEEGQAATSLDRTITIPVVADSTYNFVVDWGDGTVETLTNADMVNGLFSHTYALVGDYTVKIVGDFPRIYFEPTGSTKIQSVSQWGNIEWASMSGAFYNCDSLQVTATDSPDLSKVTDMSKMFAQSLKFNSDISGWDVSQVTNMSGLFYGAESFNNGDAALDWTNTSSVTKMDSMFFKAFNFNQDVSDWDVSAVKSMSSMFREASSFNNGGAPFDWGNKTGSVENMAAMFMFAGAFNQDISAWDVGEVLDMNSMFAYSGFNNGGVALNWGSGGAGTGTEKVQNMMAMFLGATAFNQPIGDWDVREVKFMNYMFAYSSTTFDQNIGTWNIDSLQDAAYMFYGSRLSSDNYDALLEGWAGQTRSDGTTAIQGVSFHGGTSRYCLAGAARTDLMEDGWGDGELGITSNTGGSTDDIRDGGSATPAKPSIFGGPVISICEGTTGTLSASGSGSGVTYHLYKIASPSDELVGSIPAAGSFVSFDITPTEESLYYVIATSNDTLNSGCASASSDTVTVKLDALPSIEAGALTADNYTVCRGGTVTLTLDDTKIVGSISHWERSLNADFSSVTQVAGSVSEITTASLTQVGNYYYRVAVENGVCLGYVYQEVTLAVDALSIGGNVQFTSQDTICNGETVDLKLVNSLGDVQRWEISADSGVTWTTISGVNSKTPTIPASFLSNTATTNTNKVYLIKSVVKNGECNEAESSNTVKVVVAPTSLAGVASASSLEACDGDEAIMTLSDATVGTYYWQGAKSFEATPTNDLVYTDVTSTETLLVENGDTTYYHFRAIVTSGPCDADTSNVVTIKVYPQSVAGTITGTKTSLCTGDAIDLTLAGYEGSIQWQCVSNTTGNEPIESAYRNITGATNANLNQTLSAAGAVVTYYYYRAVVISGYCFEEVSNIYRVVVYPAVVAGTINNTTPELCHNDSVRLELDDYVGSIQWQAFSNTTGNLPAVTDYQDVSTGTDSVLSKRLTTTTLDTTYYFYRAVLSSGDCGKDTSDVAMVTVYPTSMSGTIAGADTICNGGEANLTLNDYVGGIQWQRVSNNQGILPSNAAYQDIVGATSADLTQTLNVTNFDTTYYYYRAVVTSGYCNAEVSDAILVKVYPDTKAGTVSSITRLLCEGSDAALKLERYLGSIQWQVVSNTTGAVPVTTAYQDIAGATSADLIQTLNATDSKTTYYYFRALVTNGNCDTKISNVMRITVYPTTMVGTLITSTPEICNHADANFTLVGSVGSILWEVASNTTNVAPTSSSYELASAETSANLVETLSVISNDTTYYYYRAIVESGTCGKDTSNTVIVKVYPSTVGGTLSGSDTVCAGNNNINLILNGKEGSVLRWESSEDNFVTEASIVEIANTTTNYNTTNLTTTTYYRALVKSGVCDTLYSDTALVVVYGCDFGDAPDQYQTLLTSNGPVHYISTNNIYIGTTNLDDEPDGQVSVNADGDDNNGLDDEDGLVASFSTDRSQIELSNIQIVNNTGKEAYLYAWFDIGKTNIFGDDEKETARLVIPATPVNQTVSLLFTDFNYTIKPGNYYARLRVGSVEAEVSLPTGLATNGEVEDHLVCIQPDTIWVDDHSALVCETYSGNLADFISYAGTGSVSWFKADGTSLASDDFSASNYAVEDIALFDYKVTETYCGNNVTGQGSLFIKIKSELDLEDKKVVLCQDDVSQINLFTELGYVGKGIWTYVGTDPADIGTDLNGHIFDATNYVSVGTDTSFVFEYTPADGECLTNSIRLTITVTHDF